MKRLLLLCVAGVCLYACNDRAAGDTAASESTTAVADAVNYPYTATYSSQFEMGNAQYAKTILDLWKHWDNNTLDQAKDFFADTVRMQFPDGTVMHGPRDSIMAAAQSYRNTYTTVTSTVHAFVPLKSTDKNANWVCIWGTEVSEKASGQKDTTELQESWRLDDNGKIAQMIQFNAKAWPPPPQQ